MLTGGQDYGHSWTLYATRPREEPSGGALFLVMVGLGNSPHMALSYRRMIDRNYTRGPSPSMATSNVHLRRLARVGCNAQQALMEIVASLTHVNMCLRPTANSPPPTAAHSLHAAGRSRTGQWPPNCFSSARNESPGRPIADTALVGIHDTCVRSMEPARDLRFTSPLPRYASAVGTPSNSSAES